MCRNVYLILVVWVRCALPLYPQDSETREVKLLDGIWDFRADNSSSRKSGFTGQWFKKPLRQSGSVIDMPVPASYNDITQERSLRDFVGWAWYDKDFFVPKRWDDEDNLRVVLRFESCHYTCQVWVNGEEVMLHNGGHLPFEAEVTTILKYGQKNHVTVAVNNTLTPTTLPPGTIQYMNDTRKYPPGYFVQNLQMDFFNYAGIHRSVKLYTTPTVYLLDLTVVTDFDKSTGILEIQSSIAAMDMSTSKNSQGKFKHGKNDDEDIFMEYVLSDQDGKSVAEAHGRNLFKGTLNISNVNLWWPVDMGERPGYLYKLQVTSSGEKSNITDVYRQNVGFRTIDVDEKSFMINGKAFYFKGFGMHEDADIRGKGLDLAIITKDFNLIDWMGANSFRTSHYPYADEIMDFADRNGIVVIDECPGVGIQGNNMGDASLDHHKSVMKELVTRDKNHPSVVMWSVANEPMSNLKPAEQYFKSVISYTRSLDDTRPVTFVGNQSPYDDKAVKFVDVICYNHYYAWYHDYGHTEIISYQLERDLLLWYRTAEKPVLLSEYGADTVAGMHMSPSLMFTEEYQVETIKQYFPVFDKLQKSFLVGEMIWNFADFMTVQDIKRVVGNKKGIFNRQRQPKWAAHVLRDRYRSMSSSPSSSHHRDNIIEAPEDFSYSAMSPS